MADAEDGASLLSTKSVNASPDTINKLVMRLRALTFKLLPVEVPPESISEPMSRIVTPEVVKVYQDAAGDFGEALPYCLLRARQTFSRDAERNAADYDENIGRATTCEVLARRITHLVPPDRLMAVMSTRYRYRQTDGDLSGPSSALESAIDQHCTIFLSSSEAQHVINALWQGDWVQINNENGDIDYIPYREIQSSHYLGRLDPSRMAVPRYQNLFRIAVWFIFLGVYSQAVQQPVEGFDPTHNFDIWEGLLYSMALAFSIEEMHRVYVTLRYFTWMAFGFWTIVSLMTDALLLIAFSLRLAGLWITDTQLSYWYHYNSFKVLSCVAPLIWMKLITVVEGYKYIGTMTICVARMLRESVIFFGFLCVLLAGFVQGMYALDAADGTQEPNLSIVDILLQGLMQAPDFDKPTGGAFGKVMYYMWMLVTTIIMLNILISLFSSAYEDIVDNAEAQYLAFFAGKTVGMIRAPDTFVYPAPFNLIEAFLVAPFEPFVSEKTYASINRAVMSVIFFIPLMGIALYEASLRKDGPKFMHGWMRSLEAEDDENAEEHADPDVDEDGMVISKVLYADLVKRLPDTARSTEAALSDEIRKLQTQLDDLVKRLDTR
ncbi:calcium activated cation channel [Auricularia subglabra TFB-10046 SS5]|nr:calcium activated cation channel [Auricularia subglabra TFB-10046 SS5]